MLLALTLNALPESMVVADQPVVEDSMIGADSSFTHRMDFERPPQTPKAMSQLQFMHSIGPPPGRAHSSPRGQSEEMMELADRIAQRLFVQHKALTSLVAHI